MRDLPPHFQAWAIYRFLDKILEVAAFVAGLILLLFHLHILDLVAGFVFFACTPHGWSLLNLPALPFMGWSGQLARHRHPTIAAIPLLVGCLWQASITLLLVAGVALWFVDATKGWLRAGEWSWAYFVAIAPLTHMRDTDDPISIPNNLCTLVSQVFFIGLIVVSLVDPPRPCWGIYFLTSACLYSLGLFSFGLRRLPCAYRRVNRVTRNRPADGYL